MTPTSPPVRVQPATIDIEHLRLLRENIVRFLKAAALRHVQHGSLVLDVAPQNNGGIASLFPPQVVIETLDIDPTAGCTYTADLCSDNSNNIPSGRFDIIVCTEVLEHVLQPFSAMAELYRILRPGGILFLSTPFNFRIHGPLPDCWRFTEHGLRALLKEFIVLRLTPLETATRPLMPIQYTVVAQKPLAGDGPETA